MLKPGRVWQETFKIKKVGVVKVVFSFLAFLVFFGQAKTLSYKIFPINRKQGKLIRNNFSAKS